MDDTLEQAPVEDVPDAAKEAESDADIVQRAQECYRLGMDATAAWRKDALEDLAFLAGEQWDENIRGAREAAGKPALTVNRLPQFVRQVTNEQRQSKPSVTVSPVDSGSDVRTAEVLQGLIRNVEYTSNADAAYAAGGQSAAITGLGYWDVAAEYEDERSFEQKLTIRRISNALSVVMDPGAKELAGDDARWCVISTDLSAGEFAAQFPGHKMPKSSGWKGEGDAAADWVAKDGVRIHEYRWIQDEPDTLIDLADASDLLLLALFEEGVDASAGVLLASETPEHVVNKLLEAEMPARPTTRRRALWAKLAGDEVLERGELAGRYLQLVRVVGTELHIDGEVRYEGVIRHARDTQRMLNYFVSTEAEVIALAPKSPWLATPKQMEGHEEVWRTANTKAHSFLPYNYDPNAPGIPQRVMAEANVSAITNARMQASEDLKAVTGIYDAALGARSNEKSGRAILARESQAQTANFHFQDNLAMAIRYTGRILIDLIPRIYSGPRTLRILGEDGKREMVPVNGAQGEFRGEPGSIELGAGRYDVAVSMGPSYTSRRQETAALLTELSKVVPALMATAGDLIVKSLDIPGGEEIAKRLAKTLPAELRPPDENTPPAQLLAQQLSQAMEQNQAMAGRINELSDVLERNAQDNEAKERIELVKVHADLLKTMATLQSTEQLEMLKTEAALISRRLGLTGFNEPVEGMQSEGVPNG